MLDNDILLKSSQLRFSEFFPYEKSNDCCKREREGYSSEASNFVDNLLETIYTNLTRLYYRRVEMFMSINQQEVIKTSGDASL